MKSKSTACWRRHLLLLLAIATVAGMGRLEGAPFVQPAPDSPLASDGLNVYALALDHQAILVARGDRGSWNQFVTVPNARLRGMVWTNGKLYLTNAADSSLISIATAGGERTPMVVHRGSPFQAPGELAFSGNLFVADPAARALFRLVRADGANSKSEFGNPIAVETKAPIGPRTFITGWGAGEIMISDAESGLLAQVIDEGPGVKYRAMQQRIDIGTIQWNQTPGRAETIRRQGYPGVDSPAAIAVFNGILYVTDAKSGQLFVAGVHDARAIRVATPEPGVPVTRLIAAPTSIMALDASGHLHTFPRTVPAELTLLPGARPQSLFPVIEYLSRRKLLLTRTLIIAISVDDTLSTARMQWPGRGTPSEPETPEGRYASFCFLNPQHCVNSLPKNLPVGTPIVMADLYAERYTTATQVTLDGKRTLGSIVDEAITSREFDYLKTEGNLRRLNGISNEDSQLRTATTGSYRISQELVRYVIPIEATELRSGDTDYQRLLSRIRNTIRIAPLERVMTTAAGSQTSDDGQAETPIARDHDPLHPNDPQCLAARKAMADLLAAIKYTSTKGAGTVMVGVAEDDFDPGHRDLFDPSSKKSILYLVTDANELTAAPNSGVPDVAAGAEPVEWRDFETTDHGTAVAALIAGRSRPYDASGGLSSALIGMFTRTSDMTTLSQDIERALNQSNMSIVNLSLRNRGKAEAPTLRVLMEAKQRDALFVVSAPNTSSQVTLCSGQEKYYPACHGDEFENVLVVGGTTLNGDAIFAESPIGPSVHLFAPEAGYFSAGRRNAYVPVKGTSFATAIVSAAAALLRNAGVASPSLIRQRLIATADVINTPNRPQWARLLDIKRALSNVGQSVIVDANTSQESVVDVTNKSATLQFKTVSDNRTVPVTVGDLRRLRRVPGNAKQFDLAYVTPNGKNNEGLRNENLILLRVTAVGALRVCTLPNVGEDSCIDLAEYADYVGPIQ